MNQSAQCRGRTASIQTAYKAQQASEWCWAASISMIWTYYGHSVSQSEIVAGELGQVINQPGQAWQIFQALNGERTDDNGVSFTSRVTGLYDYVDGYDNISYTDIGAALNNGQPVLIGTLYMRDRRDINGRNSGVRN